MPIDDRPEMSTGTYVQSASGTGGIQRFFKPKGTTAFLRKAGKVTTPRPGALPDIGGFLFPEQKTFDTKQADKAAFESGFLEEYGQKYYTDFLTGLKDFYFEDTTAETFAPSVDYETGKTLPKPLIEGYKYGAESPMLGLKESKEEYLTGLEGIDYSISQKEKEIEAAEGTYEETEEVLRRQREAGILSAGEQRRGAEAQISQAGYQIGPADTQLRTTKEAEIMSAEELYQQKTLAREGMEDIVSQAEIDIGEFEEEGADIWKDIGEAAELYGAQLGEFGSFAQEAAGIIDTGLEQIAVVDAATDLMFKDMAVKAEKKKLLFGKRTDASKAPWKARRFNPLKEDFEVSMSAVRENLRNLEQYLPKAIEIGPAESEFSEFQYLQDEYGD